MIVAGIDPGVTGAVAWLNDGALAHIDDMPTITIRKKKHVDAAALARILAAIPDAHIAVEHVQGVQGAGATSAFNFGRSFGVIEGAVAALGVPHTLVRPQRWTRDLSVSRDKGERRRTAAALWPAHADLFTRVKDDGRADAALIAWWWHRQGETEL